MVAICSTNRIVVPLSLSALIVRPISWTISGARPRLGSSSARKRGSVISAREIASICCSPPLSLEHGSAALVGAQGQGAVALPRVRQHDRAIGALPGRVARQDGLADVERLVVLAALDQGGGQHVGGAQVEREQ